MGAGLSVWALMTDSGPSRAELTSQVDTYNQKLLDTIVREAAEDLLPEPEPEPEDSAGDTTLPSNATN